MDYISFDSLILLYEFLFNSLSQVNGIVIPSRAREEFYVGSSIQFKIVSLEKEKLLEFIERCLSRGIELKWFGDSEPKGFTSRYDSWSYIKDLPVLPNTLLILATTLDMRIPLTFTLDDCKVIVEIIQSELEKLQI